jgi:teichuronic acid biosynthesis glycosyltransferase TuaG
MISVLMPVYNGIEYIDESVTSVLEQTYGDWELIVGVNGHPPDSIVYRLAKNYEDLDPRIRVYNIPDVQGKSNALNKMLELCKYDWTAILDVDDTWLPTKLEKQVPFLDRFDVIGTKCVYFGGLEGTVPKIPVGDISAFDFKSVNPVINSSSIIRKTLASWNAAYDGVEDYDLWLRLRRNGRQFYNVDEVLVRHRIHPTSAFNSKDQRAKLAEILSK